MHGNLREIGRSESSPISLMGPDFSKSSLGDEAIIDEKADRNKNGSDA
jgi:hypothetical protein